jgi:hypothetical protein
MVATFIAADRLIPQPALLGTSAVKILDEALEWLLNAIQLWLQCLARPVATLNDILLEGTDEKHLSAAAKVWVPSLLISLIISFPVLKAYGIEWNNVGYHLSTWTTTIIGLVATAFIVHQMLLWLKLKSEFVRTLVIYTVLVATYAPVSSLLTIPATLYNFAAVQDFKQHSTAIDQAAIEYFRKGMNPTVLGGVTFAASLFATVFSMGVLALFAESMSQWYGNNRFKCYSVVAASMFFGSFVITLVLTPMQFLIIYAFVGIAPN